MRITYSPEAVEELKALREFVQVKNPPAAGRIAKLILTGINQLHTFPYLGTPVEQAPDPEVIRDLIISNYLARYLVTETQITVLRIWHQKERRDK